MEVLVGITLTRSEVIHLYSDQIQDLLKTYLLNVRIDFTNNFDNIFCLNEEYRINLKTNKDMKDIHDLLLNLLSNLLNNDHTLLLTKYISRKKAKTPIELFNRIIYNQITDAIEQIYIPIRIQIEKFRNFYLIYIKVFEIRGLSNLLNIIERVNKGDHKKDMIKYQKQMCEKNKKESLTKHTKISVDIINIIYHYITIDISKKKLMCL
jgi:hypothetical protein